MPATNVNTKTVEILKKLIKDNQLLDMYKDKSTLFAFHSKHPQRLPTTVTDALNDDKQVTITV